MSQCMWRAGSALLKLGGLLLPQGAGKAGGLGGLGGLRRQVKSHRDLEASTGVEQGWWDYRALGSSLPVPCTNCVTQVC